MLTAAPWRNWARTEEVSPRRVERPASADAVQRAVVAARAQGLPVKAVGSGHSFTGIAVAPGVQLDLAWSGVLGVDESARRATFAAGTRLYEIAGLLRPYGLALENMGDIDRQTIAGAISTGTHGTGARFGGIATQVAALTLVTGTGDLLHVSETENAELLPAVRVSLGALGIIVDVTLQCVDVFALHAVESPQPFDDVVDAWEEHNAADHFEFYWFPGTASVQTKTNTRLPADSPLEPLTPWRRWLDDRLVSTEVHRAVCQAGFAVPALLPRINRLAAALWGRREFSDLSHRVFVTDRDVRFFEMEYAIPFAAVPDAIRELRAEVARRGWRISFPVEVRSSASDDALLSTASGRRSGYIAVHRYWREAAREFRGVAPEGYFAAAEAIFRSFGGRPHWGKLNTVDAAYLRGVYPRFDEFLAVRERLDPERVFRNPYLTRVLGD